MDRRNNKPYILATAGVIIVTLSEMAAAQSAVPSYSSSSGVSLNSTAATQLISTTSLSQMLSISNALSARSSAAAGSPMMAGVQPYGMAAGAMGNKLNVWGNVGGDNSKYSSGANRFSADATNAVFGADYALSPVLSAGLSAAIDRVTGDTGPGSNYTSAGYTFAPYIGWQISKAFSLDASAGWGNGKIDSANSTSADSKRFFYGTNLNYVQWFGNWQVGGKLSFLHGEEKYNDSKVSGATIANSSSNNKIDQWRIGGQFGYWMNGVMPYLGLAYTTDNRSTTNPTGFVDATNNLGKSAVVASLGVNLISVKNSLTGGIVYNNESGRSNSKRDSLMANINYRF